MTVFRPLLFTILLWGMKPDLRAQCPQIVFVTQPADTTLCANFFVSFTAFATDTSNYQWYVNGIAIQNDSTYSGANTATLTVTNIPNSFTGNGYYCIASSPCGQSQSEATSKVATLTVLFNEEPFFASISGPTTICGDSLVTYTASVSNEDPNLVYQWTVNQEPAGSNSTSLTFEADGGPYSIECDMSAKTADCSVGFRSAPIELTIGPIVTPAVYISGPTSICRGVDFTLYTATVTNGGASPVYEWLVNGEPAGSASTLTLLTGPAPDDTLQCNVTSDAACPSPASVTSNTIAVTVPQSVPTPSVTMNASATNICAGMPVTFTATSTNGGATPTFQWQINGTDVGPDAPTWTSDTLNNDDTVIVILTGSLGCNSPISPANAIVMTVNPMPVVTIMADTVIVPGASVSLHPNVQGDIASYRWSPPTGLDNDAIAMPVATPEETTIYQLNVTTDSGCTASAEEKVIVYHALVMPNAFTPTVAGKNDVFRIPPSIGVGIRSLGIFNRWGDRVFFTQNGDDGWDGTLNGHLQPTGVYVWAIEWQDTVTGKWLFSKGTVILIR